MSGQVYEFLSDENKEMWQGLLHNALRKIQKQVHPRLDIEDESVEYLEMLIYQLLAQICSVQPHSLSDVEAHVQATFSYPIDVWSLSEAQEKLERFAARKRNVFLFPIDKIYQLLIRYVLGYKVDISVIQFIMGILDYVAADILKLAGNFVKNTHKPAVMIILRDVQVSMSADPALQALLKPLQSSTEHISALNISDVEINPDRGSLKYDELLRDLTEHESQFIRQLNLILKVFYPPFLDNPDLFPEDEVAVIFEPIMDVYELSVQLLASIEEMVEMASEMEGGTLYPQIGFSFEEVAENGEFSVYIFYTQNFSSALMSLETLLKDAEVISYFKRLSAEGKLPKLFKEAMQYMVPKALMEPIYHFFYYFSVMSAMSKATEDEDDETAFESAISGTLADKLYVERESQRFLPRRREDVGMFGRSVRYRYSLKKLVDLQARIEGWEGPDIHTQCTELVREGSLSVAKEGGRRGSRSKIERYVFLLDGLIICCKTKKSGTNAPEYRLKEKMNIRKIELIDIDDTDDLKFAFELRSDDQPGLIFFTMSPLEKNEWMAAFTWLLTRSTFERMLDAKLREEERHIPILFPDIKQYQYAEPDSEENIVFEEEQRDNQVLIKAATIHKLVERLTYHEYADPTFVRTFLMTYRSFCKPGELLNLLISRYHIPSPLDPDDLDARRDPLQREAVKRFKANYVSPIQLRVLNVFRHWVENHYYDFEQDPSLLDQLKEFVSTVKAKNVQKWVSSIHRALAKREAKSDQALSNNPVFFEPPPPIEWHLTKNKEEFHIMTLHPIEFARQLTLILSELFRAIQSAELVDASWTKDDKKENSSPNLLRMSRFETKIANWLRHSIVNMENIEERVAFCSRLVDVMLELKEMNNFAALFAFNAAFQCSQVYRLKHTMKELTPRRKQILEEIQLLASTEKGYKNYKERLRAINPPCVPFLGMYLTWIVFIRDGNDGRVKGKSDHFINFKKRRMIANILQEIQQYQNTPYCLKPETTIQEFLKSHDVQGDIPHNQWEDMLYDQSVDIEPRDQPAKKCPRKYKFDLRPPSTQPGTLAHFLEVATIRRPKHSASTVLEGQEGIVEGSIQQVKDSSGSGPQSPVTPNSLSTVLNNDNTEEEVLPPKPPPPLPPKPPHTTLSALDIGSTYIDKPPLLPPKPESYSLETVPDGFVTYRAQKTHFHRPPPIPNNDIIQPPPRPPRQPTLPVNSEPPHLQIPNNDNEAPPIPRRPHSPVPPPPPPSLQRTSSPPPPRPPPPLNKSFSPPPPPLHARVSNSKINSQTQGPGFYAIPGFRNRDNNNIPPAIPPKPSSSSPNRQIIPQVPRQRIISDPLPPIPPKPNR